MAKLEYVEAAIVRAYVEEDISRWEAIRGALLEHPSFDVGVVKTVSYQNQSVVLRVQFGSDGQAKDERSFAPIVLEVCGGLWLPSEAAERIHLAAKGTAEADGDDARRVQDGQTGQSTPKELTGNNEGVAQTGPAASSPPRFQTGDEVVLEGDPLQGGMVASPPFYEEGEWWYEIFFGKGDRRIFREQDLTTPRADVNWVGLDGLLRNLALVKLDNALSDNLYALYGSRTKFEVYQFRPALKFLGNPDQRLLIADEVGLGKTIEAGIIYLELQARLNLNRVLVVCPSGLKEKWQDELKLRFDEEFRILDAEDLRQFFDQYEQYGHGTYLRGIVSLQLFRRREFTERIVELHLHTDLVIIDEAHHCRNSGTLSHNLAVVLSESADAMLLLTATPLQTGNDDLFNLLRILAPGEFDNFNAFEQLLVPNQFINRAAGILATGDHHQALAELQKVERTAIRRRFTGNPYYRQIVGKLQQPTLNANDLISAQRRLVELNTLANIFTRTRKREIAEKSPVRRAFTLTVNFTPAEAAFYQEMIEHVRQEFKRQHGFLIGWATVMRERQAASCISAARRRFSEIAEQASFSLDEEGIIDPAIVDPDRDQDWQKQHRTDEWYATMARQRAATQHDSKFEVFLKALNGVLAEDEDSKVIVFSFFRHTIEYLYRELKRRGIGVDYIHGGIAVSDRPGIIDRFRLDPQFRVLISSEVGSEGLDFQFCNTIFNYDLPWNPMRVEQRIGRIDRFGQKSPVVRIYNLVIEDSIESRILMRLYKRIGLFERAIGDIEAILGKEIRHLTQQAYTRHLTPEEEEKLAEEAARNIVRRQQELEEFEEKRLQFMGQEAIFSTLVDHTIESGSYVSQAEVRALVGSFIRRKFNHTYLDSNQAGDDTFSLDVGHDFRQYMLDHSMQVKDGAAREFTTHLQPGKTLPVTFSDEMAFQRKLLHFINLRHPLTRAAVEYWRNSGNPTAELARARLISEEVRAGDYYLFVFKLDASGIDRTTRLVPVAIVAENGDVYSALSERLLHLLQTSASTWVGSTPALQRAQLAEAEESAKRYMTLRRNELEDEITRANESLVNARLSAIEQSYQAKSRQVEQTLQKVSNQRIRRLHQGRLRNLEAQYRIKRQEIERHRNVSVSFSLMLRGYLKVTS